MLSQGNYIAQHEVFPSSINYQETLELRYFQRLQTQKLYIQELTKINEALRQALKEAQQRNTVEAMAMMKVDERVKWLRASFRKERKEKRNAIAQLKAAAAKIYMLESKMQSSKQPRRAGKKIYLYGIVKKIYGVIVP